MKEELEKMKAELLEEASKWQQIEQDLNVPESSNAEPTGQSRDKSYSMGSHPGTGGLSFKDNGENGKLSIFMLCIITLVMQVAFLTISYFIFK